jgi:hypothetical protein
MDVNALPVRKACDLLHQQAIFVKPAQEDSAKKISLLPQSIKGVIRRDPLLLLNLRNRYDINTAIMYFLTGDKGTDFQSNTPPRLWILRSFVF